MTRIQLYSGKLFDLIDPKMEMVHIEDIAHSLSRICRFNGHVATHYSVAQHSVLISQQLPPDLRFQGLMHDAAEAYVGDITRPVKMCVPEFKVMEDRIWKVIAEKFDLPLHLDPEVKEADNRILINEKRCFDKIEQDWELQVDPFPGLKIYPWSMDIAKGAFLEQFEVLRFEMLPTESPPAASEGTRLGYKTIAIKGTNAQVRLMRHKVTGHWLVDRVDSIGNVLIVGSFNAPREEESRQYYDSVTILPEVGC